MIEKELIKLIGGHDLVTLRISDHEDNVLCDCDCDIWKLSRQKGGSRFFYGHRVITGYVNIKRIEKARLKRDLYGFGHLEMKLKAPEQPDMTQKLTNSKRYMVCLGNEYIYGITKQTLWVSLSRGDHKIVVPIQDQQLSGGIDRAIERCWKDSVVYGEVWNEKLKEWDVYIGKIISLESRSLQPIDIRKLLIRDFKILVFGDDKFLVNGCWEVCELVSGE